MYSLHSTHFSCVTQLLALIFNAFRHFHLIWRWRRRNCTASCRGGSCTMRWSSTCSHGYRRLRRTCHSRLQWRIFCFGRRTIYDSRAAGSLSADYAMSYSAHWRGAPRRFYWYSCLRSILFLSGWRLELSKPIAGSSCGRLGRSRCSCPRRKLQSYRWSPTPCCQRILQRHRWTHRWLCMHSNSAFYPSWRPSESICPFWPHISRPSWVATCH